MPYDWYHDQTIYKLERERIFKREWLYAAHTAEIPEAGDFVTTELAGYPVLILRDASGEIRAFYNICRHRAAPLLTKDCGCMEAKMITCRYHGWSYSQSGCLVGAPMLEGLTESTRAELSLATIHVAVHRGLIFINLAQDPLPFSEHFGQLIAAMDSDNSPLEAYSFHSKVTREGSFNWKVWIEGYQECYHCVTIHPIFKRDFLIGKYKVENYDRFSRHSCQRKAQSESGQFDGLWLWVYPNLCFPCYEHCFYTLQVIPLSANRTRLTYTFHFRNRSQQKAVTEFIQFVDRITDEDVSICEAVQNNLESDALSSGFLNPARENGVVYFHSMVREALFGSKMIPGIGQQKGLAVTQPL